jgi:hypothetical protein
VVINIPCVVELERVLSEASEQLRKGAKVVIETKEGWAWLRNSRNEHYFVDGRSLCGKWLGLGLDYERTMGQPECKACRRALDKREAKKNP